MIKMNMDLGKINKRLINLSKSEGFTLLHRVAKLYEEGGELSSAILLDNGYKLNKHNLSKAEIKANIIEEAGDLYTVLFDLITMAGFTEDEFIDSINTAAGKWEKVIKTHK